MFIFVSDFQNVLTLGVYLILVSIPSARTAPGYNRMDPAKLSNPCGLSEDQTDYKGGPLASYDTESLEQVILAAQIASNQVHEFNDNYVSVNLLCNS